MKIKEVWAKEVLDEEGDWKEFVEKVPYKELEFNCPCEYGICDECKNMNGED